MIGVEKLLEIRKRSHSQNPPKRFVQICGFENEIGEVQRMAWRMFGKYGQIPTLEETRKELKAFRLTKTGDREVGNPKSHFLDSGAFTLLSHAKNWAMKFKGTKSTRKTMWDFYDTEEFWNYMHEYMEFVDRNFDCIEHFANVDAIGNPEITWRNQKWFEANGFHPVPIFHYGSDWKYLNKYIDQGYTFIGIGGMVVAKNQLKLKSWIAQLFRRVHNQKEIKLHGFGLTNFEYITKFPWYSVDSTSWTQLANFGTILVPRKQKNGEWDYSRAPHYVAVSPEALKSSKGRHFSSLTPGEQKVVYQWLGEIGVPMGYSDEHGYPKLWGVCNNYLERRVVNIITFQRIVQNIKITETVGMKNRGFL